MLVAGGSVSGSRTYYVSSSFSDDMTLTSNKDYGFDLDFVSELLTIKRGLWFFEYNTDLQ